MAFGAPHLVIQTGEPILFVWPGQKTLAMSSASLAMAESVIEGFFDPRTGTLMLDLDRILLNAPRMSIGAAALGKQVEDRHERRLRLVSRLSPRDLS